MCLPEGLEDTPYNNVLHKSCLKTFSANGPVNVNQKMSVFGLENATKE